MYDFEERYERLLKAVRAVVTDSQDVVGDDNDEIEELRGAHNAMPNVEPIPTADERFA